MLTWAELKNSLQADIANTTDPIEDQDADILLVYLNDVLRNYAEMNVDWVDLIIENDNIGVVSTSTDYQLPSDFVRSTGLLEIGDEPFKLSQKRRGRSQIDSGVHYRIKNEYGEKYLVLSWLPTESDQLYNKTMRLSYQHYHPEIVGDNDEIYCASKDYIKNAVLSRYFFRQNDLYVKFSQEAARDLQKLIETNDMLSENSSDIIDYGEGFGL